MATDTKLPKLVINKLTLEQYQGIETPADDELYFVDNEADGFPAQLSGYAGYTLQADGNGGTYWGEFPSLDTAHTWTGEQTFGANVSVGSTYALDVDTINSETTGNAMLRMYYDTDKAYKVLVGSVYRQTTLLGSAERPYYAKDGEEFQAHELALKEDILHRHLVWVKWSDSTHTFYATFTGYAKSATALTSVAEMEEAFLGKKFQASGMLWGGGVDCALVAVDFTEGDTTADGFKYIASSLDNPGTLSFSSMEGLTMGDSVD